MQGLASFEEDPEVDVLLGLSGLLDVPAGQDADWHDLEGADEPDWHMAVYDSLESFEGFEGFDDYAPVHGDATDDHPVGTSAVESAAAAQTDETSSGSLVT